MDWKYFSLLSLFSVLNFLSCATLLCPLRAALAQLPMPAAGLAIYALVLVLVASFTLAAQWLLPAAALRPPWNLGQLLINVFVAAAGIGLRYLYLSWQLRVREYSELGARIQASQSRIRPHFLFNSLNTIACLVAEGGAKAERAVEDLSALFRASLQDSQVMSCWADERDLCERYLRIEAERLGDRLRVEWHIGEVDDKTPMLSLSLQPLIENAISHGIQHLPQGGDIQISAQTHAELLHITLSNPRAPEATVHGNQLACTNLRHRLQAIYGARAQLELREREQRFVVELQIPVQVG
ncbi:MAG: two-component system sensor histidine kinase AlgZ [Bacteroidia bacterium]|jgi:two-component system sensor histidine kinase AlgZ